MRIETIGPGLFVISGFANGNILALESGGRVLLVDGQSAKRVGLADSALRTATSKPVTLVVNTHYHADHTEGNAFWRSKGAAVIAHPDAALEAKRDTVIDELKWDRVHLPLEAMPTVLASDTSFRFGVEEVRLVHVPRAHTRGDLMVWLPGRDVVHAGDVIEFGAYPFLDWWAGGTLDGMIGSVDKILSIAKSSTKIVPGHGPVVRVEDVKAYRRMLETVRSRVLAALSAGKTLEQLLAEHPTREFDSKSGGEKQGRRFVSIVFQSLSRERKR